METDIKKKVEELISRIIPESKSHFADGNERIIEDLGFDSISIITLMTDIELEYQISFDDSVLFVENFYTINTLSKEIQMLIKEDNEKI